MKSQTVNNIAVFEKHINMLQKASIHMDEDEFFFEFGIYPEQVARFQEELEILKGSATKKVEKPSANKINERRLRAAVKREMLSLLYPRFTKRRILKEFSSEIFEDLSIFRNFFDSNYKLISPVNFQDEVYKRITE
jgi:hypothetical protein